MKRFYLTFLSLLVGIGLYAQTVEITGVVVDEGGAPIIGAAIMVKGTTHGVVTGPDGKFTIGAPGPDATLQVNFLGYKPREVTAQPDMRIVLATDDVAIDAVVVTGMNTIDKRLFTGAADFLNADDIKLDGMHDISRALEGRSAGVSVQNVSATFGTAPKIRIRGATSILGSSSPLWVVDGIVLENVTEISSDDLATGDAVTLISSAVAGLNADDIESFQILKDGSATSIYGARAMAGVIVVTTKKGRPGTSRINYTGEFTTRLKPSYRDYDIMNSQDQMSVYKEMEEKGWLNFSDVYRARNSGVYGQMYKLINTYDETSGQFGLENTAAAKYQFLQQAEYRNTDWFDLLFDNAVMQSHSISVSNGTEKSSTYFSLNYINDPGWYTQSKFDRYTANVNSSYNILPNLQWNMYSSLAYRKQHAPGSISRSTSRYYGEIKRDFDINPFSFATNSSRTLDPDTYYTREYAPFNIFHELQNNYIQSDVVNTKFQGEIKWTVIPNLDISVMGAVKYNTTSQQHHIKDDSNFAAAYRAMDDATIRDLNKYLYSDPDIANSLPVTILEEGGIYEKREYKQLAYDFRASATWRRTFNNVHIVNAYGGLEFNSNKRTNDWFQGWGMLYNYGELAYSNYLAFKKLEENGDNYFSLSNSIYKNAAYFATATYSYKAKYTVNGTVRYEGSNRLGKSRSARWLPTWNVSGAWNIHEEEFFENWRNVLSSLTFRASYSLTADRGPSYVTNSTQIVKSYSPWRPSTSVNETGLEIEYSANHELTYEKKHELNLGLDASFLEGRITATMDVYKRDNYDLIGRVLTQGITGEIRRYANIADMSSHGVELSVHTVNIHHPKFKWHTDLTFSYATNKIKSYNSAAYLMSLVSASIFSLEGYPVGGLFSIPYAGLDYDGLPMFTVDGQRVDQSNYGNINFQATSDYEWLKYEGPSDPPYTGGLNNTFSIGDFRLTAFFTYAFGNKLRLNPIFSNQYYDLDAHSEIFKNRWVAPGDEQYTDIPVIASYRQNTQISQLRRAYNAYNYSDARVAKGDFIRLKEISAMYQFPREKTQKWFGGDLSLKVAATNLFLLYADKKLNGQDPEYYSSGGVSSPLARQFTFTVRLGF
ncbi:MAG: SusC/RagA family TonB-linked outer membrane protein [Rikenellaceae bacterium]|nr:SusC/RagA family TonB-linked outer membrane protein [Rikenellaceae bacterium]